MRAIGVGLFGFSAKETISVVDGYVRLAQESHRKNHGVTSVAMIPSVMLYIVKPSNGLRIVSLAMMYVPSTGRFSVYQLRT